MKTFIAEGPMQAAFHQIDIPTIKADEVLIKIKYCGICGTDYAIYTGQSSFIKNGQIRYPVRFGHEWSGVVEKTGACVTGFQPGDRVVGDNFIACGKCEKCLAGNLNECTAKRHVGTINCWNGCFAEYMVMPQKHLYHVPNHVPLIEAALFENLSVAYGGIKKCAIDPTSTVVVIGTGSIGMSAAALAHYKGARQVIMIGRNAAKLDIARRMGVNDTINTNERDARRAIMELTGGAGADYVIEASGASEAVTQAFGLLAQKGFVAYLGFYETCIGDFDIDMFVSKELTATGIMGEFGNLEAAIQIASVCDLGIASMITKKIRFEDCADEFRYEAQTHSGRIKTMIVMDGGEE